MNTDVRSRILDVATELFATKGYENTTTRDIADAAGLSNSAMYYHYDNKDELLYEVLNHEITRSMVVIQRIVRSKRSPEERLRDLMDVHAKALATAPNSMKLMALNLSSLSIPHQSQLAKRQKQYVQLFVAVLDELREQNKIAEFDTTVCAYAYFGMISWAHKWYDPNGRVKPDELAGIFNNLFMKGISL